jgi:phosphate transport system ATP-binding protein
MTAQAPAPGRSRERSLAISTRQLNLWYGTFQALFDIDLGIRQGIITSMIGPSGCGKTTFLRSVNRINERLGYVRTTGTIDVMGQNIMDPGVELVQVRKQIGMVFQRPNPLPISIRENVLFGHRIHNAGKRTSRAEEDQIVENALQTVLLWDKVKDRLDKKATGGSRRGVDLGAARRVHHSDRHSQHGPGASRQ